MLVDLSLTRQKNVCKVGVFSKVLLCNLLQTWTKPLKFEEQSPSCSREQALALLSFISFIVATFETEKSVLC